jgi:hypothetical protein
MLFRRRLLALCTAGLILATTFRPAANSLTMVPCSAKSDKSDKLPGLGHARNLMRNQHP